MKIQNNLLCCFSSTVGVTSALTFTDLVIVSFAENQPQGNQQLIWNAERHPDGIYYFRLHAGEQTTTGKMVKVR